MRIFIKGFPVETSQEDLQGLVGRIAPAAAVYLPKPTVTGIFRDFAIVQFQNCETKASTSTEELQTEKCIKTLNNCLWKGRRLVVERAKEYYQDRLEKEKAETRLLETAKDQNQSSSLVCAFFPKFDASSDSYLRLKKARGGEFLKVSTLPNRSCPRNGDIKRCGRLTKFDENGLPCTEKSVLGDEDNRHQAEPLCSQRVAGRRVGFGTLLAESEKYPEEYEEPPVPFVTHVSRDDAAEEEYAKEKLKNIYDENPDVMLNKEKARNLALLASLLKEPDMVANEDQTTIHNGSSSNNENKLESLDSGYANLNTLTDIFYRDVSLYVTYSCLYIY